MFNPLAILWRALTDGNPPPKVWRVEEGPPPGVKPRKEDPLRRKGYFNVVLPAAEVADLGETTVAGGVNPRVAVRKMFREFGRLTPEEKKRFCRACLLEGMPDMTREEADLPIVDVYLTPDGFSFKEFEVVKATKARLNVEALEDRALPSVTLAGDAVNVRLEGPGPQTLSFDIVGDQLQVTENGVATLFNAADVNSLVAVGARGSVNVIQNNTGIDFTALGGNRGDTIFGGSGANVIEGGGGRDTIYALLGLNTISTAGDGPDYVLTNNGAAVTADDRDTLVRFFAPGRTPGTPAISLEGGVLYLTSSNGGSSILIEDGQRRGDVTVTYDLDLTDDVGPVTASFSGVEFISWFGGSGADTYLNNSRVSEAAYGSGGADSLTGGFGAKSVLKGSGGDDSLTGRARENDLSGNGGADLITSVNPGRDVFRVDLLDAVYGADNRDLFITP
jgi:hypothetical protein